MSKKSAKKGEKTAAKKVHLQDLAAQGETRGGAGKADLVSGFQGGCSIGSARDANLFS